MSALTFKAVPPVIGASFPFLSWTWTTEIRTVVTKVAWAGRLGSRLA